MTVQPADGSPVAQSFWWGPFSRFGLTLAAVILLLDQASKLWLLFGYRLGEQGPVHLLPGVDLVLTWNRGISYGLFQQDTALGRWLLVLFTAAAVIVFVLWLARVHTRIGAVALGLVIGGAIGNGIDRGVYGAVADFVLLYVNTAAISFSWYVFNLADVAIVAGVAGLLYESLLGERAAKAP